MTTRFPVPSHLSATILTRYVSSKGQMSQMNPLRQKSKYVIDAVEFLWTFKNVEYLCGRNFTPSHSTNEWIRIGSSSYVQNTDCWLNETKMDGSAVCLYFSQLLKTIIEDSYTSRQQQRSSLILLKENFIIHFSTRPINW